VFPLYTGDRLLSLWCTSMLGSFSPNVCMSPISMPFLMKTRCVFLGNKQVSGWYIAELVDPSGRVVYGLGLRPNACWDSGFESHRGHVCLYCTVFGLSGRGLCNGSIPCAEESYRLVCAWVCLNEITKTLNTCCEQVGRRGKDQENDIAELYASNL
jgi:hypothetical protein